MQDINLPRLNRIWEGIQSGRLQHVQDTYHCKTAHCVAGWEVCFLIQEHNMELQETTGGSTSIKQIHELGQKLGFDLSYYADDAELAAASLGLNDNEVTVLFNPEATTNVQAALVAYLNTGKRLPVKFCDADYCFSYKHSYKGSSCLTLKGSEAIWKDFTDFLQQKGVGYDFEPRNYDR